jgi:hypothetical protein
MLLINPITHPNPVLLAVTRENMKDNSGERPDKITATYFDFTEYNALFVTGNSVAAKRLDDHNHKSTVTLNIT